MSGGVRGWLSADSGICWRGGTREAIGGEFISEEPHFVEWDGINGKTNLLAKKVTKLCVCVWGGGR